MTTYDTQCMVEGEVVSIPYKTQVRVIGHTKIPFVNVSSDKPKMEGNITGFPYEDNGARRATFDFLDKTSGAFPNYPNWYDISSGSSYVRIVNNYDGHKKVMHMYDPSVSYQSRMEYYYSIQNTGFIEFWFNIDYVSAGRIEISISDTCQIEFNSDNSITANDGTSFSLSTGASFTPDSWFHVKIEWTLTTYNLYINDISVFTGWDTINPSLGAASLTVFSSVSSSSESYVNAIGVSWDSGYSEGDNKDLVRGYPRMEGDVDGFMKNGIAAAGYVRPIYLNEQIRLEGFPAIPYTSQIGMRGVPYEYGNRIRLEGIYREPTWQMRMQGRSVGNYINQIKIEGDILPIPFLGNPYQDATENFNNRSVGTFQYTGGWTQLNVPPATSTVDIREFTYPVYRHMDMEVGVGGAGTWISLKYDTGSTTSSNANIEFWVRVDSSNLPSIQIIFFEILSSTNGVHMALKVDPTTLQIVVSTYATGINMVADTWHHFRVFQRISGNTDVWMDNIQIASGVGPVSSESDIRSIKIGIDGGTAKLLFDSFGFDWIGGYSVGDNRVWTNPSGIMMEGITNGNYTKRMKMTGYLGGSSYTQRIRAIGQLGFYHWDNIRIVGTPSFPITEQIRMAGNLAVIVSDQIKVNGFVPNSVYEQIRMAGTIGAIALSEGIKIEGTLSQIPYFKNISVDGDVYTQYKKQIRVQTELQPIPFPRWIFDYLSSVSFNSPWDDSEWSWNEGVFENVEIVDSYTDGYEKTHITTLEMIDDISWDYLNIEWDFIYEFGGSKDLFIEFWLAPVSISVTGTQSNGYFFFAIEDDSGVQLIFWIDGNNNLWAYNWSIGPVNLGLFIMDKWQHMRIEAHETGGWSLWIDLVQKINAWPVLSDGGLTGVFKRLSMGTGTLTSEEVQADFYIDAIGITTDTEYSPGDNLTQIKTEPYDQGSPWVRMEGTKIDVSILDNLIVEGEVRPIDHKSQIKIESETEGLALEEKIKMEGNIPATGDIVHRMKCSGWFGERPRRPPYDMRMTLDHFIRRMRGTVRIYHYNVEEGTYDHHEYVKPDPVIYDLTGYAFFTRNRKIRVETQKFGMADTFQAYLVVNTANLPPGLDMIDERHDIIEYNDPELGILNYRFKEHGIAFEEWHGLVEYSLESMHPLRRFNLSVQTQIGCEGSVIGELFDFGVRMRGYVEGSIREQIRVEGDVGYAVLKDGVRSKGTVENIDVQEPTKVEGTIRAIDHEKNIKVEGEVDSP